MRHQSDAKKRRRATDAKKNLIAQKKLIEALLCQLQQHGPVRLIETHISWVLLTADVAYKFKKALQLDFLDYATLDARRFCCNEEIRLNRRLAPHMYLGVSAIHGPLHSPVIDGPGAALEYAVKMRAFDQQALWEYRVSHSLIGAQEVDLLADKLARFHCSAALAPSASNWGTPALIAARTDADLAAVKALLKPGNEKTMFDAIVCWQAARQVELAPVFARRKALGWVRECHGDLHCGNIVTAEHGVEVFDCIEFNPALRWLDVIHDLAFVIMDLLCRARPDLAARLMNRHLQHSGDYSGLAVLRYYMVQRAMVRCKVALLRCRQQDGAALKAEDKSKDAPDNVAGTEAEDDEATKTARAQASAYLACAFHSLTPAPAAIIIAHGFSGSGKSTVCDALVGVLGALQLRSDIERKRLYRIRPGAHSKAQPVAGIYTPRATSAVYLRLRRLAARITAAGFPVIVDAAFLQCAQRRQFRQLAQALGLPFFILDVHANCARASSSASWPEPMPRTPDWACWNTSWPRTSHWAAMNCPM
jgi:aminoglycoside phosphotransferase family enzyme/predicted kinase